jgi:hypothetical protein
MSVSGFRTCAIRGQSINMSDEYSVFANFTEAKQHMLSPAYRNAGRQVSTTKLGNKKARWCSGLFCVIETLS